MELFFSLIVIGFLISYALFLILPKAYTDGTFLAVPARLMFGIAAVVCAMNALLRFFPGTASAWMIVVGLAAIALVHAKKRQLSGANKAALICTLAVVLLVLAWRLITPIALAQLVPAEGTGNSDELWYVFSADWLRVHSLADPFPSDPRFPLASAAGVNIGQLPRIGSESLLVFLSAVSGARIEQVYPLLFALAAVLFCFASAQGFIQEADKNTRFLALSLVMVAISPVALFIFGNGNFATLWGLIFLGGYYWNMQRALADAQAQGCLLASGVFLGALIATYPELLAIVMPATGILFLQALKLNRARFLPYLKTLALCGVVAIVVAPWAFADAAKVLATGASAARGPNIIFPELFTSLTLGNSLITVLAFDTSIVQRWLGNAGPGLASALLLAALCFSPKRVWSATAALLVGSLLVFAVFWRQNYGYGGMKAIEFIALPACTLLGAAAGRAVTFLDGRRSGRAAGSAFWSSRALVGFVQAGCVLLVVGMFGLISYDRSAEFHAYGKNASLSGELMDLSRARNVLPPDAVVLVGPELGPRSFLTSRWVAYLLPDVALVYPPELHDGGYIYGLNENFAERASKVSHVLRARNAGGGDLTGAVLRNARFELVPVGNIPFTIGSGFHGNEGWGRWMSGSAELSLIGSCGRVLHIGVRERFGALQGEDAIVVSDGRDASRFELKNGKGEITFPVREGTQKVRLTSVAGAKSPASIGAGDTRELSYAIDKIDLASCAR